MTTLTFVDVGQGDCTVGSDDSGAAFLIDCPEGASERALHVLRESDADVLELVVATHNDLDHIGGLYAVVTAFPTRTLRINDATVLPSDPKERARLKATLRALSGLQRDGVYLESAKAGDSGAVGEFTWEVLAPDQAQLLYAQGTGNPNHASIVSMLRAHGFKILIAGDADGRSWRNLLSAGSDLSADVLLVPHHGARMQGTANGADISELLSAVDPQLCVLSFGPNGYGHPASYTLAALVATSACVASTGNLVMPGGNTPWRVGTIALVYDG